MFELLFCIALIDIVHGNYDKHEKMTEKEKNEMCKKAIVAYLRAIEARQIEYYTNVYNSLIKEQCLFNQHIEDSYINNMKIELHEYYKEIYMSVKEYIKERNKCSGEEIKKHTINEKNFLFAKNLIMYSFKMMDSCINFSQESEAKFERELEEIKTRFYTALEEQRTSLGLDSSEDESEVLRQG